MEWIPGGKKIEEKMWQSVEAAPFPKFGQGQPLLEKENCPEITAFFACYGTAGLSVDKRRLILPQTNSIIDAKLAYITSIGKPIDQHLISDENSFVFADQDIRRPLWYFSNKCNVNFTFTYASISDHITKPLRSLSGNRVDAS